VVDHWTKTLQLETRPAGPLKPGSLSLDSVRLMFEKAKKERVNRCAVLPRFR